MTMTELLALMLFVPLALATNTALPIPFEPVLLLFAEATPRHAWLFVLLGAACSGAAAGAELSVLGQVRAAVPPAWLAWVPRGRGRSFHVWTALMAASPIPFSVVRLAVVGQTPRPVPYALAVAAGRLPRWALTLWAWQALALPAWANAALGALIAALVLAALRRSAKDRYSERMLSSGLTRTARTAGGRLPASVISAERPAAARNVAASAGRTPASSASIPLPAA